MILRELTRYFVNGTGIYTSSQLEKIYILSDNKWYEYYDVNNGISNGWSSNTTDMVPAVSYVHTRIHQHIGHLTYIDFTGRYGLFLVKDKSGYDVIKIDEQNSVYITDVVRTNNEIYIRSTGNARYIISDTFDINGKHLGTLDGIEVVYTIPPPYRDRRLYIHTFADNILVDMRFVDPSKPSAIYPPSAPSLVVDDHGVRISWTVSNPFDWYTIIKRRNDTVQSWSIVAYYNVSHMVYDSEVHYSDDGYFYRVIGVKDNVFYVGPEAYVYVPTDELRLTKPHGRAVSDSELVSKWMAPTIIKCGE